MQTLLIISVCNNQLLNWIENGKFASTFPGVIANLHAVKDKYLKAPVSPNVEGKNWGFSFASVWNTVVWLMLMNFFVKIVNSTAQGYLKKRQERELAAASSTD